MPVLTLQSAGGGGAGGDATGESSDSVPLPPRTGGADAPVAPSELPGDEPGPLGQGAGAPGGGYEGLRFKREPRPSTGADRGEPSEPDTTGKPADRPDQPSPADAGPDRPADRGADLADALLDGSLTTTDADVERFVRRLHRELDRRRRIERERRDL